MKKASLCNEFIFGRSTSHASAATSLINLACAYLEFGQLQTALVIPEQRLNMKRAVCGTNAAHPEIAYSFGDLSNVHAQLGSVQKTSNFQEKRKEMS